ncbi:hypothetical protein ONE63_010532 [Megalurothrips usitatus]|uniref:Uncharacterized protein n=1 Tax=Megalurothrips usitatus TaxID=439358 RepID=A0AAV7XH99_9NEOP|nr:hypothetical protein ONE63_010532 [Megalurothrips usitatus]
MAFLRLAARCPASATLGCVNPSLHGKSLEPLRAGFLPLSTSSAAAKSASAAAATEALRVGQTGADQASQATKGQRRDVLDASFDDAHAAYKSKTTWEILRAYIVYTLCSSTYLVEHNMQSAEDPPAPVFAEIWRGSRLHNADDISLCQR